MCTKVRHPYQKQFVETKNPIKNMSGFQEISMKIQPYDNRDFAPGCLPQLKIRIESRGCQSRQQGFHGSELISVRDHWTLNPKVS